MKGSLVLIILIASLLIAGCTTQSVGQNSISQSDETSTLKTPEVSQTALVSDNQPKDITYSDDNERWNLYNDKYDHFRIYKANDWIVAPMDSPYVEPSTDEYGTIEQMRKQVWIYPPTREGNYLTSANGVIIITGYTITNPNKSYTPKQMNDIFSRSFAERMQKQQGVTNVQVDNTEYLINGNSATHLMFDSTKDVATYDNYQVVRDYAFYNLQWAGNKEYAPIASKIMRTFDPYSA